MNRRQLTPKSGAMGQSISLPTSRRARCGLFTDLCFGRSGIPNVEIRDRSPFVIPAAGTPRCSLAQAEFLGTWGNGLHPENWQPSRERCVRTPFWQATDSRRQMVSRA
jgi:hypothetical protein